MAINDQTKQTALSMHLTLPEGVSRAAFINENELATVTGMSVSFYQKNRWQHQGHAPYGCPFYKFGRSVKYRLSEVLTWLESSKRSGDSLAEAG